MIELLVERLRWPAALVRERAATQIGALIAEGDKTALEALLAWIARQELESLVAVGLHPLVHAANRDRTHLPSVQRVASACRASSLLAELLLTEYDPTYEPHLSNCRHSDSPIDSLHHDASDRRDPAGPIRDYLRERLERVGQKIGVALGPQFDREVAHLRASYGWSSSTAFGASRSGYYGRHPGWSPLTTEILRSAYLRSLSYGASKVGVDCEWLTDSAATEAPVDLGLWQLATGERPRWWPAVESAAQQGEFDVEVADALAQVEVATRVWDSENDVVLAASGCISQSIRGQRELEVRSFIQWPVGPLGPQSEDLFDFVRNADAYVTPDRTPLRFEGAVRMNASPELLADWFVGTCSGTAFPISLHFWQGWRRLRGVQCPSPLLSNGPVEVVAGESSLDFVGEEGLVARWTDWTSDMSALLVEGLPPSSGWILTAPRDTVARVELETGGQFARCWELTSYFRESGIGEFKEHKSHGAVGTSRIIRP